MTIKYLDAKRVQGSSTAEKTPTYSTDFSATTGWTSNDTHVYIDTANTMLEFHNNASSIDEFLQYDFGSGNVSDDNWILRFEMYFNNLDLNGTGGQTNQMCFGFTDNASLSGETPSGDNLRFTMDAGAGSYLDRLTSIDGGSATHTDVTNDPFSTSTSTATPYYVEIKRVSDSSVEMRVFTTSDYSTTQYGTTITRATSSSVTNLRYLTVNIFSLTVTGDGCTGYLKNLKFWNDTATTTQDDKATLVTSASTKNDGWTQTGSTIEVVDSVGIDIDTVGTSGTNKVRHLIGTTLSDTEWVCRFKLNHKDSGGAESPILALCKTDTTGDDFWSNAIMVYANSSSGSDPAELSATYYSSSANGQSSSITLVDGTTYYVELIRTASDNVTISVFTGSDYLTGQVGSTQAVNSSNITGIDDLISIQSALGTTNGARDIDVVIQEIKIYNGITSVSSETPVYETNFSASSNLPENTIFNETDTHSQWWLQDGKWIG